MGKTDTVVVLSRSAIELRPLTFPPVPDDEIPEMAKFIAGKEFSEFDTATPFDVFFLPEIEKGKKTVLGATLSKAKLTEITEICTFAGLNLKRIVVAPFETAALFTKNERFSIGTTSLLMEFSGKTVTFSVLYQGYPVFVRSVIFSDDFQEKLGKKNPDWSGDLFPEIKKTLFSGTQIAAVQKIDKIVLSGESSVYQQMADSISQFTQLPVDVVDFWENIARSGEIKKQLPPFSEVFVPLVAGIFSPNANKPSPLDFVSPKRKKESGQQRQLIAAAIMFLFLLFTALIGYGYFRRTNLEQEVGTLQSKVATLENTVAMKEQKRNQAEAVANWKKNQILWLQELAWLSEKIPASEDTLLTSLQLRAVDGTGEMKFQGTVKNARVVPILETSLWDDTHQLRSQKTTELSNAKDYPYTFDITVLAVSAKEKSVKKADPTEKIEEKETEKDNKSGQNNEKPEETNSPDVKPDVPEPDHTEPVDSPSGDTMPEEEKTDATNSEVKS
ncbi:MAG: hypothetical protein LBQ54_13985 [Planctomycetaceae bacterium]|nr:hypothetical protein [Planctomycetaceae bacterium]